MAAMGLRALGDSAWLFEAGGNTARGKLELVLRVVEILERERIPEVRDIVSSFASVAVHFDPADGERVLSWLTSLPPPKGDERLDGGRLVEVPVDYGDDLGSVAAALNLSAEEIIRLHSGAEYTVAAVGFSPGFPYLHGLPDALHLPRLATPRKVPAGSVAIAGNQAGIYPFESQGGWHVLGRTNLWLFDPFRENPSLLKPGDKVRFVPVNGITPPEKPTIRIRAGGGLEIIEPGAITSVQDLGRPGFQSLGVSPGGAADPVAARVANRLVGNPDGAAVLECCMSGPVLKFTRAARVAFIGWGDSRAGRPIEMDAGGELDLRRGMRSVRGYVAIDGGIDVLELLGSRATDLRAGFGGFQGRKLNAGDVLPLGKAGHAIPHGPWQVGWPRTQAPGRMIELRFLSGMQAGWFTEKARQLFQSAVYQTSPVSDRMGARLEGPELALEQAREMVSQPVTAGSVQVPPDGKPIILLAERQTIGGYPQIGHVISADLPLLARAWPGTPVRFREVTLDEARAAWSALQRDLAFLQTGLDFLR